MDPYKHMQVTHHFIGGIYTKECHMPPGLVYHQHRHTFDHQSILVSGEAELEVNGEKTHLVGPAVVNIKARTNHSVRPITPIVWLCQHVTDKTDPDTIDEELIE